MMKMEIKMNEEKVNAEKKYKLDKIYLALDKHFERVGLPKVEDDSDILTYRGNDDKDDFANFGIMVIGLKKQAWFTENVAIWRLYESDDTVDPDDFAVSDLVEYYREKGIIRR